VGAVLCSHDGRRGLIYHLAVAPAHHGQGIGKRLVQECITGLRDAGITRHSSSWRKTMPRDIRSGSAMDGKTLRARFSWELIFEKLRRCWQCHLACGPLNPSPRRSAELANRAGSNPRA
jgi:GNAT superfamily N-acetyltransferase